MVNMTQPSILDTEATKLRQIKSEGSFINDIARIEYLANLPRLEYERIRDAHAKAMGVRTSVLDSEVHSKRKHRNTKSDGLNFENILPWESSVEGSELLTEIATTVKRFVVCTDETAYATALWISMTWFMDVVQIAPLAVITAPEKRCGKSLLLSLIGRLAYRPLTASNISPAALFRSVDAWKPTLLIDEADAFMRDNEELRGLINAGHTRDNAYIIRVVGDDHTPKRFNVWGAKAIAGIGHLADTLMDRAVVLELRRKLPNETVDRLRRAETRLFDDIASKLARFSEDNREALKRCKPDLPDELHDRAQDNWEPLLAIAEVAGGNWPEIARQSALKLSASSDTSNTVGNELLLNIQEIFKSKQEQTVSLKDLSHKLCDNADLGWSTYNRGKPITTRQISKLLKSYGIKPKAIRFEYEVSKGYEVHSFEEAFSRYLPNQA